MLERREFLRNAALAGLAASAPLQWLLKDEAFAGMFSRPLLILPVLKPIDSNGERDLYRTVMKRSSVDILSRRATPAWTFDGSFPGPTIKVRSGRRAVVRRVNKLDVPVSIHLHGAKVRSSSDGHPMDHVHPGRSKDYVYPNEQEACTLWYHDHTHHLASRNNYRGLQGMYIISDEVEDELNLPRGRYDVPLIIQNRSFKRNGSFDFDFHHNRIHGDRLLVNGRPTPHMKVANRKYRFRILNASHSRGYRLALANGDPLMQIASDQGLLSAPAPAQAIPLWPSERAEVVIDFSRYPLGTKLVLVHVREDLDPQGGRPIMRFDVASEATDNSELPAVLRPVQRMLPGTIERQFDLSFDLDRNKWVINGKVFDPDRIDVSPRLGDTEVWTFRNQSSKTHPMHIHLVRFQILDRSNLALTPGELGWKDTVRVDPATNVRVVMKFEGYAGRYMFHCHNLAHEDRSMMGQMRTLNP